ncbi:DUF4270 family protein [Pontibacter harenae]|uniref:DUF4270 family protein n=1 Tax=Pontibacter harenae TaxID=2894083 RepID=UPI001E5A4F89|nr:DUF4270 family protein [Pontibacter harenae]MCC9166651.1 DUF4270 domain-containing protein [Pontibacter harenae]
MIKSKFRDNRSAGILSLLLSLPLILASCEDTEDVGLELIDGNVSAVYIDTVTVDVSTVLLDSVVTSATGTMLVGNYTDPIVGNTTASTFFQVDLNYYSWTLSDNAVFDSIALVLPYTGYSYGDTTQALNLEVYKLKNNIVATDLLPYVGTEESASYFYAGSGNYNISSTAAETQPLATHTFQPRPGSGDSLNIPLPAAMGQEWFNLKMAGDNKLTQSDAFLDYFKGLKVATANAGQGGAVIGFDAASAVIRLYYSEGSTDNYQDFPVTSGSLQYNNLVNDFSQSNFQGLNRGGEPLASTSTADMSFTQAGTGVMVKLEFPYLSKLKEILQPELINSVILEVQPVANTYGYPFTAPSQVALYESDFNNVPTNLLYANYTTTSGQVASLQEDTEYQVNSKYQFNITEYLINKLQEEQSTGKALLLSAPAESFTKTVNRLVVGGPNHTSNKVKIKIYYTKIQ